MTETKKQDNKTEKFQKENNKKKLAETQEKIKSEERKKDKKVKKKPEVKKAKGKKQAIVVAKNMPISTKQSVAICKFIKNKPINQAIDELREVALKKRAIPMKGEIPHRKGKGISSGRYPEKAVKNFLSLLKSLTGNAIYHEIEEPVIVETIANIGERPYGRFGRVRKKRTHIKITAKPSKGLKSKNKSNTNLKMKKSQEKKNNGRKENN